MHTLQRSITQRGWLRTSGLALMMTVLLLVASQPAHGQSARSEFNRGRDAEARQDFIAAYEAYKYAYNKKPRDIRYRASYERMRVEAAAVYVKRGQGLRDQGKLEDAVQQFQNALAVDSGSFIAQQELRKTQQMIDERQKGGTSSAPPAETPKSPLSKRIDNAAGPVELNPISEQPITLKLTEDAKVVYETIGKLAGINVLFDPDYTSRRIKVELNNVSLREALEIVSFESKTFWRPVTSNTLFVASDTQAKRKELEQSVVKTFYLGNVSQPTELQDIINTLRTILEINRIQQLPSQNAIVMRGSPDQIALAEKLIGDIDKARPEVLVDVVVMQVQRDKLHNLGIQPPASTSVGITTPKVTTSSSGSTTVVLGSLKNFSPSSNLSVSLPTATANYLFSDSATKIIQNPQIRALDGQKASLKIGDRVPVATGSFQPGIGGVGINPLVNTQFQYIDVGVNIDVTPHVHANRDVTLKVSLDVSAVTRTAIIGGIEQPVIGQRKIEHEIRLKEGEVNLLGGILDQQDIKALSGVPGLAQVPFLKYFFSSEKKEKVDNEIVFMLVPHVVRAQDVSELNIKPLDVGSGNAIELRMAGSTPNQPAPAAATAPSASAPQPSAPAVTPEPAAQPAPVTPSQPSAPAPSSPVQGTSLRFDPPVATVPAVGGTLALNLVLGSEKPVHAFSVELQYDPKILQVVNVSNGGFLAQDGQAVAVVHRDDATAGRLKISGERPPSTTGVTGEGNVFTITFVAKAAGQTSVLPVGLFARDDANNAVPMTAQQANVTVGK
jgi:general secretion pathway protein D